MRLRDYFREGDIARKLTRGIIQIDGDWVYSHTVEGQLLYYYSDPDPKAGEKVKSISIDEQMERFNFRNYKLGMCNTKDGVIYCTRNTNRQWNQTLNSETTHCMNVVGGHAVNIRNIFKDAKDMLNNNYPSPQNAWSFVTGDKYPTGSPSRAFDRDFALVRNGIGEVGLIYKDCLVGTCNNINSNGLPRFSLFESFFYLKERLEKIGITTNIYGAL